jgi:hypothetical protein
MQRSEQEANCGACCLGLLVGTLIAISLAGAPAAAAVSGGRGAETSRPPITPRAGKPFVPATGDWEGSANGFPASFELRYVPRYASRYRLPPYGFTDIVTLEPASCPVVPYSYSENFLDETLSTPVRAGGSFGLARVGLRGGLTGSRTSVLSTVFRLPPGGGAPGCNGSLTWRLHPAQRRAVADGIWRLRFPDGTSETFEVRAGGRLATGIALPAAVTNCGATGVVDMFIATDGRARYAKPSALAVTLDFARRTASGEITVTGGGCANAPFPVSASLMRRSG